MGKSNGNGAGNDKVSSDIINYVQAQLQELDPDATLQDAVRLSRSLSDEYQHLKEQGPLYSPERREISGLQEYVETVFKAGNAFRIDKSSLEAARRYGQRIDPTLTPERSQTIDAVFQ
ncbi:hypothetical protein HYS47_01410 [Candidatus Woesearchaeota archaeon]|nr:hypothetical protein [Candidatus Woesearchaeota archaeon]